MLIPSSSHTLTFCISLFQKDFAWRQSMTCVHQLAEGPHEYLCLEAVLRLFYIYNYLVAIFFMPFSECLLHTVRHSSSTTLHTVFVFNSYSSPSWEKVAVTWGAGRTCFRLSACTQWNSQKNMHGVPPRTVWGWGEVKCSGRESQCGAY